MREPSPLCLVVVVLLVGCRIGYDVPPDGTGDRGQQELGSGGATAESLPQFYPDPAGGGGGNEACGVCATGEVCNGTSCVLPKRVFVTSHGFNADFGGVIGADDACTEIAQETGLGGKWKAWLSDSKSSPTIRFYRSPVPYVLLNGAIIANDWEDLTDGSLLAEIDLDETGQVRATREVWTATLAVGTPSSENCRDWTTPVVGQKAAQGLTNRRDSGWSQAYMQYCNRGSISLYCFEQ